MWPNPQIPANLVTFTEEILKGPVMQIYQNKYMIASTQVTSSEIFA